MPRPVRQRLQALAQEQRQRPVQPPPHLRHVARGRRHPLTRHRWADGPRRRPNRARVSPMGALYQEITPSRPISTHAVGARRSLAPL